MNNGGRIDKILIGFALVTLYLFCGIVVVYVPVPDLTLVMVGVLAFATYDFWVSLARKGAEGPTQSNLEQRPTGVSGKALMTAKELEADVERSLRANKSGNSSSRNPKTPADRPRKTTTASPRRATKRGGAGRNTPGRGAPKSK